MKDAGVKCFFSGKVLKSEMSDLYSAPRHVWTLFISTCTSARAHTHTQQLQSRKHTHVPLRARTATAPFLMKPQWGFGALSRPGIKPTPQNLRDGPVHVSHPTADPHTAALTRRRQEPRRHQHQDQCTAGSLMHPRSR